MQVLLRQREILPGLSSLLQGRNRQTDWEEVLNEYLFKKDGRADDMLVPMFAGLLHPIIHLGFGVEFEQPIIMAEALAQAPVHDNRGSSEGN